LGLLCISLYFYSLTPSCKKSVAYEKKSSMPIQAYPLDLGPIGEGNSLVRLVRATFADQIFVSLLCHFTIMGVWNLLNVRSGPPCVDPNCSQLLYAVQQMRHTYIPGHPYCLICYRQTQGCHTTRSCDSSGIAESFTRRGRFK